MRLRPSSLGGRRGWRWRTCRSSSRGSGL